ncbi:MAG TPA: D-Ala-D-Ala carboxypeptidase family metallohydrolase [Blastocatellia bacterium]|nr:D-Ala-D-Ala carboxypeptidase family metallohydrolase [Blastocatellia bacterium]
MGPADWQLIRHFKPQEFRYPERMGYEFMLKLDRLRREAGVPMRITSDYRTKAHNKAVGGAADSAHCDDVCEAVDVMPANSADAFQIMRAAFLVGFSRIGIYANGSFHFDTTGERRPDHVLWHVVSNPA